MAETYFSTWRHIFKGEKSDLIILPMLSYCGKSDLHSAFGKPLTISCCFIHHHFSKENRFFRNDCIDHFCGFAITGTLKMKLLIMSAWIWVWGEQNQIKFHRKYGLYYTLWFPFYFYLSYLEDLDYIVLDT